jgi:Amt family ammonium transporter
VAVLVTWVLGFVVTTIILKVLDATMGLRISDEDEMAGLDLSQHSETAYVLGGSSYGEYSTAGTAASLAEPTRAGRH